MNQAPIFWESFKISSELIGQLAICVFLGWLLIKAKIITESLLGQLTRLMIDVLIPCVFLSSLAGTMNLSNLKESAVLMAVSAGWTILTLLLCIAFYRIFPLASASEERTVTAMAMVQNGIYIPIPIVFALIPEPLQAKAALLIGMAVLPSVTAQWTIGVNLLSRQGKMSANDRIKLLFNPPLVSLIAGSLIAFIPGVQSAAQGAPGAFGPLKTIFSAIHFIGSALSPLAMLVLGAFIGSIRLAGRVKLRHLVPLIVWRLLLLPGLLVLAIRADMIHLTALSALILIVEAAAPPATNHSLVAKRFNGEWELVSSLQLAAHIVAILTYSLWIAVGLLFFKELI